MTDLALWGEFLPLTLSRAARLAPFFSRTLQGFPLEAISSRRALAALPKTSRRDLIEAGRGALAAEGNEEVFVQNTSGSSGQFLFLHRSRAEQHFWADFSSKLFPPATGPRPLSLALYIPTHGTPIAIRSGHLHLMQSVISKSTAGNVLRFLATDFDIPNTERRISALEGPLAQVLTATAFARHHQFDPAEAALKRIVVTGDYLSHSQRCYLEGFWGAEVINRFSMTEIMGGATQSGYGSSFFFDPHLVPTLDNVVPGCTGAGELAVTVLYPFVQLQPLIQYRTGDVFAQSDRQLANELEFKGRVEQCLLDGERLLISGTSVYDALDQSPLVARTAPWVNVGLNGGDDALGHPIVTGEMEHRSGHKRLQLKIYSKHDVAYFRSAVRHECRLIRHRVLRANPLAAEQERDGRISLAVQFCPWHSSLLSAFDGGGPLWSSINIDAPTNLGGPDSSQPVRPRAPATA